MPGEDFHLSDLARFQAHPRTPTGVRFSKIHNPPVARYASLPGANFLHASGVQTSSPEGLRGH